MSRRSLTAAAAALLLTTIALGGCKTSESNYRAAYESAVAHRDDNAVVGSDVLNAIALENMPQMVAVGTDSVPVMTLRMGPVDRPGTVAPYSIAAGRFKQKFNAQALCTRLKDAGYADSFVASTVDKDYVTVAGSYESLADAALAYPTLCKLMRLPAPFPVIIRAPGAK